MDDDDDDDDDDEAVVTTIAVLVKNQSRKQTLKSWPLSVVNSPSPDGCPEISSMWPLYTASPNRLLSTSGIAQ